MIVNARSSRFPTRCPMTWTQSVPVERCKSRPHVDGTASRLRSRVDAEASRVERRTTRGPARGAVIGITLLILVFAMFALAPARIRIPAIFAFGTLAPVMIWRDATSPERYPFEVEATHTMFALIIVASITILSIRMGTLRETLHRQKSEPSHAPEQNRRLATLDELTGLVNRRHMTTTLQAEHERESTSTTYAPATACRDGAARSSS